MPKTKWNVLKSVLMSLGFVTALLFVTLLGVGDNPKMPGIIHFILGVTAACLFHLMEKAQNDYIRGKQQNTDLQKRVSVGSHILTEAFEDSCMPYEALTNRIETQNGKKYLVIVTRVTDEDSEVPKDGPM